MAGNEHLNAEQISAFIDQEAGANESQTVRQHLAQCHGCTLSMVAAMQLKMATAVAGQRFAPAPDTLARLAAKVDLGSPQLHNPPSSARWPRVWAWSALAASLLLAMVVLAGQQTRETNRLSAELLDQHLATLSAAASPEVISSDKHTVKPWFQGKLPFSFNLPEAKELPPGTLLKGADLTYLRGMPAALLLFTIDKHEVSVFLMQRGGGAWMSPSSSRSGFAIRSAVTKEMRFIAVSDVDARELSLLVASLVQAQGGA